MNEANSRDFFSLQSDSMDSLDDANFRVPGKTVPISIAQGQLIRRRLGGAEVPIIVCTCASRSKLEQFVNSHI